MISKAYCHWIVSAMERVRSKNLYTNGFTRNELWNFRLMFLKTLAPIYGFYCIKNLWRSNAIELLMSIITTLFTLRLFCGKSFVWFCLDIFKQILWGILFGSASRVNWDKLTVVKWCKILNRSVSVIGLYVISFESTGLKLSRYKYLWLVWKLEKSLHKSISWWLRLPQVFSDW